ncbi:MAG: DUF805 domain-containing protein [Hyphomicrobiales bacterium]
MDWRHLFLGFKGRIGRQQYWAATVIIVAASMMLGFAGSALLVLASTAGRAGLVFVTVLLLAAVIYPAAAVTVKRLHDREMSAWWLIPFSILPTIFHVWGDIIGGEDRIVPVSVLSAICSVWAIVELGFLKGTDGPNAYGTDPLAGNRTDAAF